MQAICLCGQSISDKPRCPICGVRWERDKSGVWAIGFRAMLFTPSRQKLNHYERYMKWRNRTSKTEKPQRESKKTGLKS